VDIDYNYCICYKQFISVNDTIIGTPLVQSVVRRVIFK